MRHSHVAVGLLVVLIAIVAGGYKLMNSTTHQLFGEHTARVETSEKMVALTFDDGPTCGDLEAVLKAMADERGTFFVNGQSMQACPAGAHELVAAGHELGNHTWSHRAMVFLTMQDITREISSTDVAIEAAGHNGPIFVRPPYGKKLLLFPWWLDQTDRHTILWDVSMETWSGPEQSARELADKTIAEVQPGSVVLLHPWHGRDVVQGSIPLIIDALRADGYRFVTISELLSSVKH